MITAMPYLPPEPPELTRAVTHDREKQASIPLDGPDDLRDKEEVSTESRPSRMNIQGNVVCSDNIAFMSRLPDSMFKLIVTSPPYNLDKSYEKKCGLDEYLAAQEYVIRECVRLLQQGSICWQVGNYAEKGEIIPIDTLLAKPWKTITGN